MESIRALDEAFIRQIAPLLGDELPAFLRALDDSPALALRINPLRPGAGEAAAEFAQDAVPWEPNGRYLKEGTRPGASLAHACGAFYLQEASAMVSAAALSAQPGEKILDLCAAPGGKSGQIAAAMMGRGLLVSNEPIPGRAKILAENLERLGVVNAIATCAYPDRLAARWPEFFDAVLVDAPCSGEGMFRREPNSREEWNPAAPAGCAKRQADILDCAVRMLRPGGRLVYSTCTFNPIENEGSIAALLDRHPDLEPEDFSLNGLGASKDGMLRVWPHRARGDGHFAARLRKGGQPKSAPPAKFKPTRPRPARPARTVSEETPEQLLNRLEAEICTLPEVLRGGTLIRQGDYIHALPIGAPPLDGVKTVKPGLCLMRVGRSHIQPMPALAMASCADPSFDHLGRALHRFELDEPSAKRFLAGERPLFPEQTERGWTLLTWRGLPLGFAKVSPK